MTLSLFFRSLFALAVLALAGVVVAAALPAVPEIRQARDPAARCARGSLPSATEAVLSPDGRRVAIMLPNRVDVISSTGSGRPRVIFRARTWLDLPKAVPEQPSLWWSPDQRRVALQLETGEVLVIPANGGRPFQLPVGHDDPFLQRHVSVGGWTPDSSALAIETDGELALVNATTGARHVLATGLNIFASIAVSPDGRWLAYTGDRLELVSTDGTSRREIVPPPPGAGSPLVWSPDGTQLAYMAWVPGPNDPNHVPHLHVIGADGTNARVFGEAETAIWTPRAIYTNVQASSPQFPMRIDVTDPALGRSHPLLPRVSDTNMLASASGDGDVLIYHLWRQHKGVSQISEGLRYLDLKHKIDRPLLPCRST